MAGVEDRSEFEGGGVMPNSVFPKGVDALDNSDILRLDAITGQHEDSRAQVNPFHWWGNMRPDPEIDRKIQADARTKERRLAQAEAKRYRETPLPY